MNSSKSLTNQPAADPRLAPPINMTEEQCAQYLTISTRNLRNLRRSRQIPYVKLGGRIIYRRAEVDKAIARLEIKSV
jgi:excisionase family DNA binding protein